MFVIYKQNGFSQYDGDFYVGVSVKHRRFCFNNPSRNYAHQIFYYQNGHLFRAFIDENGRVREDEFAYIHLHQRKYTDNLLYGFDGDAFYITPDGFFEKKSCEEIDKKDIYKYNKFRGALYERYELFKCRLNDHRARVRARKKVQYKYVHIIYQMKF